MSTSFYTEDCPGPAGSGVAMPHNAAQLLIEGQPEGQDERVTVTEWIRKDDPRFVFIPHFTLPWENDIHSYHGFRPLSDQVLVRPLPASDRLSSASLILIPGSHDRGRLDNRLGTVLALGPGDPVAVKCGGCNGTGNRATEPWCFFYCHKCDATGFTGEVARTSFEVAVGDTVLYAPRGWAEIEIAGESLIVLHDCQTVLAVVNPETVLFTEDATTKKKAPDWIR